MSIFANLFGGYNPFGGGTDPSQPPPGGLLDGGSRMPALYNGLLSAGGAMLAGGDPRYPQGFGQALGRGFLGLSQGIQNGQETAARNQYMRMHAQNYANLQKDREAQAARDAQQNQYVSQAIAALPPEEQAKARAFPDQFAKTLYPAPQQPTSDMQNYEYGKTHPDFVNYDLSRRKAGATTVSVGGPTTTINPPIPTTSGTATTLQTEQFNAAQQLARINQIDKGFKPEYLQLGERAKQAGNAWRDFIGGPVALDDAAKKSLTEFTQFRRDTVENVNKAIKDATGSAMGVQESQRLMAQVPVAGVGIMDGDGPTEFQAKLQGVKKALKLSLMRYHFALKRNLNPLETGIDLADVPKLIDKRGAELEAQVLQQNPNLPPDRVKMEVAARLADEFGAGQ